MYPVGAWVSHPVHICPWIMVISNSHEHCIYVRDFGVGQILVFTTPASPQLLSFFANAGWLPQKLSCLVVCFPYISITDNLSSIVVFLNASLFTLYPMFVGTLAWWIKVLPLTPIMVNPDSARWFLCEFPAPFYSKLMSPVFPIFHLLQFETLYRVAASNQPYWMSSFPLFSELQTGLLNHSIICLK